MPQLMKKRRSGWAILAAGAFVVSLLAVGVAPAAAAPIGGASDSNAKSVRTACLGPALDGAGFTDVDMGSAHYDSINCIAYYGITVGVTADIYGARDDVRREHMALFLTRMAAKTGFALDDNSDAGFSDLAGLDAGRVNAINSLVNEGIMTGSGDGTFSPGASVSRAEMALWLVNFMAFVTNDLSPLNVTQEKTGEYKLEVGETEITEEYFGDSRATQARHVDSAIGVAFELGIAYGYSDLNFRPNQAVSRAEMASFITRTLGHTNLRPAGLTAQAAGNPTVGYDVQVSVRDADFLTVPNVPIDLFRSPHPDAAFNEDDGSCETRWAWAIEPSFFPCEIDDGDQVTYDDGNAEYDTNQTGLGPESTTIVCTTGGITNGVYPAGDPVGSTPDDTSWAWTGDHEEEVDEDTDLFEVVIVVPFRRLVGAAPHHAQVTGGLTGPNQHEARFGQNVEYTVQLHADPDKYTGPMGEHVATGPDSSGNQYNLVMTRHYVLYEYFNVTDTEVLTDAAAITQARVDGDTVVRRRVDLSDAVPGRQAQIDPNRLISVTPLDPEDPRNAPDENGTLTIPVTHPDSDPASNNDDVIVSFVLTAFGTDAEADDYNGARAVDEDEANRGAFEVSAAVRAAAGADDDAFDGYIHTYESGDIVFSDDGIDHDRLLISGSASYEYRELPRQTRNKVIVTVLDQYGRLYRGFPVNAVSDQDGDEAPDADGGTSTLPFVQYFVTRSNGSYPISYSYNGGPITETLQTFGHEDRPERDTVNASDPETPVNVRGDDPATVDTNEAVAGDGVLDRPDGDTAAIGDPEDPALEAGLDGARVNLRQGLGAGAGANNVTVHWANIGQVTSGAATLAEDDILVIDVDNRKFVVNNPEGATNAGRPHIYAWDAFDTFVVGDTLVSMELFESVLSEAAPKIKVQVDSIAWESYDYFRLNDRARWTIQATCTGGINDATS